ncbi:MAG: sigma 54-interacting transcriptional regulator [Desulfomicrobium sp.]
MIDINALRQLAFEISARIIRSGPDSLDQDIVESLARLIPMAKADRGGLLSVLEDTSEAQVAFNWFASGVQIVAKEGNRAEMFPWCYAQLVKHQRVVAFRSLDDLPPEAHVDRKSHEFIGNKSVLLIPLPIGSKVHHLLALNTVNEERAWPEELVRLLQMLGESFVSALQRREAENVLKNSLERLDLAAESAGLGLWEFDAKAGTFWGTERVHDHFGFPSGRLFTVPQVLERIAPEDRDSFRVSLEDSLKGQNVMRAEFRVVGPDGATRWIVARGRVTPVGSSGEVRFTGITVDISARKEMEQRLRAQLEQIQELKRRLENENEYLRAEASIQHDQTEVLGSCQLMRSLMTQVRQVSSTGSSVLLLGETGTGKGLIAQTIHRLSDRASRPMVKVNCAALPGALVESELFGREKGAFTGALSRQKGRFEMADRSTLFLDEVAEMPLETQAKLLRVLQDGEFERLGSCHTIKVDVRLIAATNRDLEEEVACGRFRRDLFYRLNVFPILVPPLRDRREDISALVWEFVGEFGERMGKKIRRISARDMNALQMYSWPGNIRELRNVIEHSMIVSQGDTLEVQRLSAAAVHEERSGSLEDMEREYIRQVLGKTGGRIKGPQGAAELLGMNPSTLYSRMRKLGIAFQRT